MGTRRRRQTMTGERGRGSVRHKHIHTNLDKVENAHVLGITPVQLLLKEEEEEEEEEDEEEDEEEEEEEEEEEVEEGLFKANAVNEEEEEGFLSWFLSGFISTDKSALPPSTDQVAVSAPTWE